MKSFKEHLKEYKIYSVNPDGSKSLNKIEQINFHLSDLQKSQGYKNVVEVSDLFHSNYKKSEEYISISGKKDKYSNENIRNLMKNGNNLEYPCVNVDGDGNIKFVNGGHRYGIMNRLKMERKVCLADNCLENCRKHGYIK